MEGSAAVHEAEDDRPLEGGGIGDVEVRGAGSGKIVPVIDAGERSFYREGGPGKVPHEVATDIDFTELDGHQQDVVKIARVLVLEHDDAGADQLGDTLQAGFAGEFKHADDAPLLGVHRLQDDRARIIFRSAYCEHEPAGTARNDAGGAEVEEFVGICDYRATVDYGGVLNIGAVNLGGITVHRGEEQTDDTFVADD